MADWQIIPFVESDHGAQVVTLWRGVFAYDTPHNDPRLALRKKVENDDGLLFVAQQSTGEVIGTIMAGYDGHRGWIYSLAVQPEQRGQGIGTALVRHVEEVLVARGCLKINLQILASNQEVERFYHHLGFETEERINMGKRLHLAEQDAE